uniref:Period circadian protein n=1 Tax=Anopheles atroparvus TaxID=41427 RepID=A0A182J4U8_ANOAO
MSATGMENMEGVESTHNAKVSDSAYSNSCSNSQSQRSGSSKTRHSGSNSSGSSGYGGKASTQASSIAPLPIVKRTKEKDRKKKKQKTSTDKPVPVSHGAFTEQQGSITAIVPIADGNGANGGEQAALHESESQQMDTVSGAASNVDTNCGDGASAGSEGDSGTGGSQQAGHAGETKAHKGNEEAADAEQIINEEKAKDDCKQQTEDHLQHAGSSSTTTGLQKKNVVKSILPGPAALPAGVASVINSIAAGDDSMRGGSGAGQPMSGGSLVRIARSDQQQQQQQGQKQGQHLQQPHLESEQQQAMHAASKEQQQPKQQQQQQGAETQQLLNPSHQPQQADQHQQKSQQESNTQRTTKPDVEDGFCCVISMHDGVVLFTTPSITHSLGFPKDMWLGRSFNDFVHPKDRATFASQITSKAVFPLGESKSGQKDQKNSLYVMLRKYRGLKSAGFGVTKTTVNYAPYRLVLTFREAPAENAEVMNGRSILLIISATPVKSVYKQPNESLSQRELKFSTRHMTSGVLSYVDGNSVESIGYLPQDILGRSIMELYHPDDMPVLRKVYETVMVKGQTVGASFVSQPYRFLVNNGCYIVLSTEWRSFVNPWSRELEFVTGTHRILQGPAIADVFAPPFYSHSQHLFPDEVLKEAKLIEEQILRLLKEPFKRPSDMVKQEVSKRCKALASFMEELMDEVAQPELKLNLLNESDFTFSERDSVMLGEISPHHEYFDSKSSSETPPSYNQLNYNENLQRFFDSRPVMNIEEQQKMDSSGGTNTETIDEQTHASPNQRGFSASGGGGSGGSAGNFSSESNAQMDSTTNTTSKTGGTAGNKGTSSGGGGGSFLPPTLTEELLYQHNEDMQKVMLKKHREARMVARGTEKNKKGPPDKGAAHGVKRGSSHSWEGDAHKVIKHQHTAVDPNGASCSQQLHQKVGPVASQALQQQLLIQQQQQQQRQQQQQQHQQQQPQRQHSMPQHQQHHHHHLGQYGQSPMQPHQQQQRQHSDLPPLNHAINSGTSVGTGNLWPPFSVGGPPAVDSGTGQTPIMPSPHNMFPTMFFFPAPAAATAATPTPQSGVPYIATGVMYPHPQLYQQSHRLNSPMMYHAMPYQPVPPPCGLGSDTRNSSGSVQGTTGNGGHSASNGNNMPAYMTVPPSAGSGSLSQTPFQRPSSQATSVKAEPGSALGSIASASIVANRAFSESSKKDLTDSPVVSNLDFADCGLDELLSKGWRQGGAERGGGRLEDGSRTNRTAGATGTGTGQLGKSTSGGGTRGNAGDGSGKGELSDDMDDSSFSSFYSSFVKSDNSSQGHSGTEKKESNEMVWESGLMHAATDGRMRAGSGRGDANGAQEGSRTGKGGTNANAAGDRAKRRPDPPWLENVCQTNDLIYRYQMNERSIKDLLESDKLELKKLNQPNPVNDQLGQLYVDLELQGLSSKLTLSEATSGSSSDDCDTKDVTKVNKRNMRYSQKMMIFEENAPFPPPNVAAP